MKTFKLLTMILLLGLFAKPSFGQDKFREDYNYIAVYDGEEWGKWISGNNTFVLNANYNGDVILYKANGEKETFRKVSEKEEGYAQGTEKYQAIILVSEAGEEIMLQYFDDPSVGIKLIYSGDFMIQFARI